MAEQGHGVQGLWYRGLWLAPSMGLSAATCPMSLSLYAGLPYASLHSEHPQQHLNPGLAETRVPFLRLYCGDQQLHEWTEFTTRPLRWPPLHLDYASCHLAFPLCCHGSPHVGTLAPRGSESLYLSICKSRKQPSALAPPR